MRIWHLGLALVLLVALFYAAFRQGHSITPSSKPSSRPAASPRPMQDSRARAEAPTTCAKVDVQPEPTGFAGVRNASTDEEFLAALEALTEWFLAGGKESIASSVRTIKDPSMPPRLRAALLILLGLVDESQAGDLLLEESTAPEDFLAAPALKAMLLRHVKSRVLPFDAAKLRDFWRGILFDDELKDLIDPGFVVRQFWEKLGPGGAPKTMPFTVWSGIMPAKVTKLGDDIENAFVRAAVDGRSALARIFALRELPWATKTTDDACEQIAAQPTASPNVRAIAYETHSVHGDPWPFFVAAAKRETDPRVLAGLCTMLARSCGDDHRLENVALLESLAPLAAQFPDSQIASRLAEALSLSETTEGLAALVHIARETSSQGLRGNAISAIGYCGCDTKLAAQRAGALRQLADDVSDPVAAEAIFCLSQAAHVRFLNGAVQPLVDSALLSRAKALVASQSISDLDRKHLDVALKIFASK